MVHGSCWLDLWYRYRVDGRNTWLLAHAHYFSIKIRKAILMSMDINDWQRGEAGDLEELLQLREIKGIGLCPPILAHKVSLPSLLHWRSVCMSFCQWCPSVNEPSKLTLSNAMFVCPSVSEPSKLTSSKVMCLWICMSFCQWAFQAYFVEGHVFVNLYVFLSVSLPSLLRQRSCVCEFVCLSVSEPSKLTSSKVMCLSMCMSYCQWAFQA